MLKRLARMVLVLIIGAYIALIVLALFADRIIFQPQPSSYTDASLQALLKKRVFRQGEKLFTLANEPKVFLPIDGAGHNDVVLIAGKKYMAALQQFAGSIH